jgi:hypothetical protein
MYLVAAWNKNDSSGLQPYTVRVVQMTIVITALVVYWLSSWPLVPKIAGSLPAEAVRFFRRKNPQHAFLQKGSKAIYSMSQICSM